MTLKKAVARGIVAVSAGGLLSVLVWLAGLLWAENPRYFVFLVGWIIFVFVLPWAIMNC